LTARNAQHGTFRHIDALAVHQKLTAAAHDDIDFVVLLTKSNKMVSVHISGRQTPIKRTDTIFT
jgi:hypothetical protein